MDIDKDISNINNSNIPDVKRHYRVFKDELIKLDTHNNIINSVNNFKSENERKNKAQILSISNDINTVRRQIEISENDSLMKYDFINILQVVFLYLGLLFLIIFGLTGSMYMTPLIVILSVFFTWITLRKIFNIMNRNTNRWTLYQFNPKVKL